MKKQKGAGLIEVLVTLFIISVGMLGIAGLQTVGMFVGQEASQRTSALLVVEDITSRMQVNRMGAYNITTGVGSYTVTKENLGVDNKCHDKVGGVPARVCTPQKLAKHDIFLWKKNLSNVLPNAKASITFKNIGNPANGVIQVFVDVSWKARGQKKNYISELRIYTK